MPILPLYFQDLNFRERPIPWVWQGGHFGKRWVAFGMPRFRPSIYLSCFYLYRRDPKTGKRVGPCGTGTLVAWKSKVPGAVPHAYAFTSQHAIPKGASIIRLNTLRSGLPLQVRWLDYELDEWKFIPGGDDIAAIDVTDDIEENDFVRASRAEEDFVTQKFIRDAGLTIGEDGFMVGLFSENPGTKFNLPAVRFGNLSQLANFTHHIKQGHGIKRPSHVFDMHSRPGFSGSPVFIYRTPGNDLDAIEPDGTYTLDPSKPYSAFIKLLGIHSGQFLEKVKVEKAKVKVGKAEAIGRKKPITEGDIIQIQSSMTIIVPAWAITELLNLPVFQERREMREGEQAKAGGPQIQPETASGERVETGIAESYADTHADNPRHKEDFTALLNEAAKKRLPSD